MSSRQPKKAKRKNSLVKTRPRAPPTGKRQREPDYADADDGADIFHDVQQPDRQAAADSDSDQEAQETAEGKRLRLGACVSCVCGLCPLPSDSHVYAICLQMLVHDRQSPLRLARSCACVQFCILCCSTAAINFLLDDCAASCWLQPRRTSRECGSWTPPSAAATRMRTTMREASGTPSCRSACAAKLWRCTFRRDHVSSGDKSLRTPQQQGGSHAAASARTAAARGCAGQGASLYSSLDSHDRDKQPDWSLKTLLVTQHITTEVGRVVGSSTQGLDVGRRRRAGICSGA